MKKACGFWISRICAPCWNMSASMPPSYAPDMAILPPLQWALFNERCCALKTKGQSIFSVNPHWIFLTGCGQMHRAVGWSMSWQPIDWCNHRGYMPRHRSEEHTSELQSRGHLVCRLL